MKKRYQEVLDRRERNIRIYNALRGVQGLCLIGVFLLTCSFFPPNQGSISGEHQQYNYARSLFARHHKVLIGKTLLGCLVVGGITESVVQALVGGDPSDPSRAALDG